MSITFKERNVKTYEAFLGVNKGKYRVLYDTWCVIGGHVNIKVQKQSPGNKEWEDVRENLPNIDEAKGFIFGLDYALPANP